MKNDSGQTTSVWRATAEVPEFSPLAEDTQADVCIVGAGIAGLTTAYLLAREGKSVAVFDDGRIGGGMTERTTAHLSNAFDDRYQEMENLHGEHGSRLIADSHTAAIDRIEQIVIEEKIECEFERLDGYLFAALNQSKEILEGELKSAHRAGLEGVEQVGRAPIADFDTGMCLRFPRQAQFHPLKYLAGLARAIERDGGRIFTATHITEMEGGAKTYVKTSDGHTVTAEAIVIATNAPINNIVTIHTKQAPYTTYAIGARVPRGSVTRALYWDTLDPYHYVRLESSELDNYDLLIVGGEDHKSGQVDDYQERHARLEAWARERWPMIEAVEFQWSGQVMEPVDGVAFIGRNPGDPRNVYIATGDSGMGMTHGMIAGILITDLIAGRTCSWVPLYDPSRVTLRAAGDFARENFNVVAQYATGLAGPGDVGSAEEVAPGTGAVIRRGLSKVAVYCDESGVRHELSAVCKHLGCIVDWNPVESSWDCPCHGSRFNKNGHVITGPANSDLDPVGE
jgi:glycine/D-amino acid oxidase-like deaminating enzyme/nitrite reductase/ring-hydroxylating ferredoxin subunit